MKREEGVILKIMVDLMENKKKYEENRVILESLRENATKVIRLKVKKIDLR